MTRADTPTWTRGRRIPAVLMAVAAIVAPVGCSGGGGGGHGPSGKPSASASSAAASTATPSTAGPSASKGAATKVAIANFAYAPSPLTVGKGTTVTWTNNDAAPHTVTSDGGSGPLRSPTLDRGASYSYRFDSTGTFTYYCTVHPNMHGTVVVK